MTTMDDDGKSNVTSSEASEYYLSINEGNVRETFCNLDDSKNLGHLMSAVQNNETKNFVVDFSDHSAFAAFNLCTRSIEALFEAERPEALSTRWINIFGPYRNRSLLELIGRRYDFSPRLLALMTSDPMLNGQDATPSAAQKPDRKRFWQRRPDPQADVDEPAGDDEISEQMSISSGQSVVRGNLYRITDNIWHYTSVDFGRQYVCIGYNSLYGIKHRGDESTMKSKQDSSEKPLPHCARVWTWLLLTQDGCVISINEDPFPFANGRLSVMQLCILKEIRRNLVNVFRSLTSLQSDPLLARDPMTLLPIRIRLGATPQESAHRESDAPGLLFYYLFENWHNSYTLVTRKESRYGVELGQLRREMFEQPKLVHIDRLDRIGKELGVLKKHYQAYGRIIYRLLEPQSATSASLQNSQIVTVDSQASLNTIRPIVLERDSMMGVALSSAARVRFKRLCDLLDLYALSEVDEYIKQKESLVTMNFNLIAIKQSLDVDRLTRITLLLTKATILFLPTSLATAYFSTDLVGVEYTVQTYWISFAAIFTLSWLALFLFGVINGNMQATEVLKGLWRGVKLLARYASYSANGKKEKDVEKAQ